MKHSPKTKWLPFLTALFLFSVALTVPAAATVFNVNTTNDTHAANLLTGTDANGNISLRSALEAAEAAGGTHTINLPAGIYLLTEGTIYFGDVAENITINGAGSSLSIIDMDAGPAQDRIFMINSTASTADVHTTINDVQFRNGHLNSDPYGGGAIRAGGPLNVLTLNNCIFSNNTLDLFNGGTTGGAINVSGGGALNIDRCTFTGNSNPVSDGGAVYYFLQNFPGLTGSMSITNSTFSNNTATSDGGGSGGAIGFAEAGATIGQSFSVTITENTFTNNTAPGGNGGAISAYNGFGPTGTVNINYNRFTGNSASGSSTSGLAMTSSSGSVNATNNWWGCNSGPTASPCNRAAVVGSGGSGSLTTSPWLQLKASASPGSICTMAPGNTSTITAGFLSNSSNIAVAAADLDAVIGLPVTFVNPVLGTLSGAQATIQASGTATVTFTSNGTGGSGSVNAVVDNVPDNDPVAKASVIINAGPTINTQPANTTECAGSTAQFTVSASGSAPLSYQWYRGATLLSNGPSGSGSTYSGVTTTTLTITNTGTTDNGNDYNVVVSNNCGTTTSASRSLTVVSITVTNPAVTTGTQGVPFSQSFTQSGGTPTVLFSTSSVLPPGLTLSSAGVLSGTPTGNGSFNIVVTATDANGCIGTGPDYNLVISCPPPVTSCPGNTTVSNDPGFCNAVVNYTIGVTTSPPPTITYAFSGATTGSGSGTGSGSTFIKGTTTVTVTVTNSCSMATCTFNITVNDTEAPTASNPGTVNVQCISAVPAPNTAVVTGEADNCGSTSVSFVSDANNGGSGCLENPYIVTRTYRVTDGSGNSIDVVQTITAIDNTAPVLTGTLPGGAVGNVCFANIPEAPSTEEITSQYTDNCTAVSVAFSGTALAGDNCNWTVTYTYAVTDGCGNSTNATVTYTGGDTEAPHPVDPLPGGPAGNLCKSAAPAAPSTATIASKYADNCSAVNAILLSSGVTGTDCSWTATYTYSISDGCGNAAANAVVIYTGGDTEAPDLISALPGGASGNLCRSAAPAAPSTATIASRYADNCSAVVATLTGSNITGTDCNWTATYTYSVKDACNNSTTAAVVYTGGDTQAPTFTRPADITILFTSICGYNASVANTGDVTNEADNCSTGLNATFTDATSDCGNNTVITRTWHLVDNCGNAAADQVQTITVTDNISNYIIYATNEAKFGEDNTINGDVGVTSATGIADFRKGDILDPYHVYAKNINVQLPAMVNNKHFVSATGGPNPAFQVYNGTGGSGSYIATSNGTITGNYKSLVINTGVTVTLTGNDFGRIRIEEGANVTFTSGLINMEELSVGKGVKGVHTTNVYFTGCTGVKIKKSVSVEEVCRVNVDGPKVIFYLGDSSPDEEKFTVKGDDTWITLNIMIPNGKLMINGGVDNCIMTGWFIIEKLNGDGKNVIWNKYACSPPAFAKNIEKAEPAKEIVTQEPVIKEETLVVKENFAVRVYPNPSSNVFLLKVLGAGIEPVTIRILDATGIVRSTNTSITKGSLITVGGELKAGTYFAEVIQGNNRQVVRLVKLN